jgi:hypothetical protein
MGVESVFGSSWMTSVSDPGSMDTGGGAGGSVSAWQTPSRACSRSATRATACVGVLACRRIVKRGPGGDFQCLQTNGRMNGVRRDSPRGGARSFSWVITYRLSVAHACRIF